MRYPVDRGSALLGVLAVIILTGILVAVSSRLSQSAIQGSTNEQFFTEALYTAESGLEAARYAIARAACNPAIPMVTSTSIQGRGQYQYTVTYADTTTTPSATEPTWTITSTGFAPSIASPIGRQVLTWQITQCYPICPGGKTFPTVTYQPDDITVINDSATLSPSSVTTHRNVLFNINHTTLTTTGADGSRYDVERMDPDVAQTTFNMSAGDYYIKTLDVGGSNTDFCVSSGSGGPNFTVTSGKANLHVLNFCSRQNTDYNIQTCDPTKAQNLTIYVYGTAEIKANTNICGIMRGCSPTATMIFEQGSSTEINGGIAGIWSNGTYNSSNNSISGLGTPSNGIVTYYDTAVAAELNGAQYSTTAKNWRAIY